MTEVLSPPSQPPVGSGRMATKPIRISPPPTRFQGGQSTLDVFSPVNQNGSFEFDRVLKSGEVMKRTRKTKAWKPIYLVLRPNVLSIYKDKDETQLKHKLNLSELTAVARQRDPKKKSRHVFGVFSPSRNFHLSVALETEAQEWVEIIRREARIDEEDDEERMIMSPTERTHGFGQLAQGGMTSRKDLLSSSSELERRPGSAIGKENHPGTLSRTHSHTMAYSGNERTSFSDFSDTGGFRGSTLSLANPNPGAKTIYQGGRPSTQRNASQYSGVGVPPDEERVICQSWVYILKSKGGVRQWKKVWMVLRPKCLALYKNEEEYSASLILPFSTIINAVDIDPISRSKRYCMQIISEERSYRFCTADEDSLAKWLGAFKSLLARRKDAKLQQSNVPDVTLSETNPQTAPTGTK